MAIHIRGEVIQRAWKSLCLEELPVVEEAKFPIKAIRPAASA